MSLDPREAVRSELMGETYGTREKNSVHKARMHLNGPPHLQHDAYTLQDKVTHAAKEVTLWLPRRSLEELRRENKHNNGFDTTLGHSIDAASYAEYIWRAIERIAEKLGVDLSDLE